MRDFAGDAPQHGTGIILDHIADQNAESGKRAGQGGHDHVRDAEGFGQGAGVEASGATEGDQGEVAGIAATLDGDHADGFLHGGIDHADDTGGETFQVQRTSLSLQPLAGDAAGAVEIEGEVTAEEAGGLQAAEKKVGVCDRGLRAAAVADGAGIGAGGFGTDAENAAGIEAGERASAGADGVDIEHGDADGESGDFGVAGRADSAFDQGDIGGCAAHFEGNDAGETAAAGAGGGADEASGRSGENGADGLAGGSGEGRYAAAGLHYEDSGAPRYLRS